MITAAFTVIDGSVRSFSVSGHSGYSEQGSDIVCAAVSSAALMCANTITDVQHLDAEIAVNDDGFLSMKLSQQDAEAARVTLEGFRLHLNALSEAYPDYIQVKNSEV